MRPVDRGPLPKDKDGNDVLYTAYANARRDLIKRLGEYCCYCNQKLPASLAVEHIQPKTPVPALELVWTNFLLGCTNCNSHKGATPVDLDDYVWPDVHNTHLAFQYNADGTIEVNPLITDLTLRTRIQNMLNLVGLQVYADHSTASDRRWKNRKNAFEKATNALSLLEQAAKQGAAHIAAQYVAQWAPDSGFFSIWFTMFKDHPAVQRALIESFLGTAANAFDRHMVPQKRTVLL